jgi:hypothetical protein
LDPTAPVDVKVEAIGAEFHHVGAPGHGFPDDVGARSLTRSLGEFVGVRLTDGKPGFLLFAPGHR